MLIRSFFKLVVLPFSKTGLVGVVALQKSTCAKRLTNDGNKESALIEGTTQDALTLCTVDFGLKNYQQPHNPSSSQRSKPKV
jgi:hypothetical protein